MSDKTLAPSFLGSPAFASKHLKTNTICDVVQMNLNCGFGRDRHIQLRRMMGLTHMFEATTLRRSEKTEHVSYQNVIPQDSDSCCCLNNVPISSSKAQPVKGRISCHAWMPNSTDDHPKLNFSSATWMPPSSVLLSTCTILRPTNVLKNPDQYQMGSI